MKDEIFLWLKKGYFLSGTLLNVISSHIFTENKETQKNTFFDQKHEFKKGSYVSRTLLNIISTSI